MQCLKALSKPKLLLGLGLFILAIITRLLFINLIPTTFSHDELDYLINAKSVAVSGVGRYGDWKPLSLKPVESSLAELPTTLLAGFFHLPFSSTINARLLPVLMSLTLPFLIASISFSLLKSKRGAFFSWALALFNPWIWQNGRLVFDIPISLWFYVLGIALFLHFKSWKKLVALLPFFIGFYSYQGFKLILPFIGIALSIYVLFEKKLSWKKIGPSLITSIFAVGLLTYYLVFQFSGQADSKARISNQIITPQSEIVSQAVNTDRRLALATPINNIFLNKYTQTFKEIIGRYLLVFNGKNLFYEINAAASSFAVWNHGPFYLIDAVLIGLGILALIKRKQHSPLLLISTLAITGVLPSVLNQTAWLYFRPSFLFPLLLILAGAGLNLIWENHRWIFKLTVLIYVISIINFSFLYFVRYPVYASENIYFSPRLLAEYLNRVPETQEVIVFEKEPKFAFTSLVFYYNLFDSEDADVIHQAYEAEKYQYKNISFLSCVPADLEPNPTTTYVFDNDVPDCQNPAEHGGEPTPIKEIFLKSTKNNRAIFIKSIKDSGEDYAIYNQTLCSNPEKLSHFISPKSLRLFDLSKLPLDEFCQNWLTQGLPTGN